MAQQLKGENLKLETDFPLDFSSEYFLSFHCYEAVTMESRLSPCMSVFVGGNSPISLLLSLIIICVVITSGFIRSVLPIKA